MWGDIPAKGWRIQNHGQGRGPLLPGYILVRGPSRLYKKTRKEAV